MSGCGFTFYPDFGVSGYALANYDPKTKVINLNLLGIFDWTIREFGIVSNEDDILCWKLTEILNHEFMHHILNKLVSKDACLRFDIIEPFL